MPEESEAIRPPKVADAERMRTRALDAGRWFGGYLAVVGLVSALWIVLLETVFADGVARIATAAVWALFMVLASWWAERHEVYPARATRRMWLSVAMWFLTYLLVVGPLVRWQFGDSVAAWVLAAVVMSTPFFVAAGLVLRRR